MDTLPVSTLLISPCLDRVKAAPVQSWKEEIHSRRRVMAAMLRKYFCFVPSRAPPPEAEKSTVKLLSTTGESRENRKPVEESSNGECRASLERKNEVNWCEVPT